jgi:hypothetical protein
MLMTPVVFSPGARSRAPDSAWITGMPETFRALKAAKVWEVDLVILETHERDRLLGRERSAYIRVRDPERSSTLIGNRIANVEPVLRSVNLFECDLHAVSVTAFVASWVLFPRLPSLPA